MGIGGKPSKQHDFLHEQFSIRTFSRKRSLLQTYQSVSVGYRSARSPEFLQTDLMQTLRWMRMIGDTVFAVGAIVFVYFAFDLIVRQRGATVGARKEAAVAELV